MRQTLCTSPRAYPAPTVGLTEGLTSRCTRRKNILATELSTAEQADARSSKCPGSGVTPASRECSRRGWTRGTAPKNLNRGSYRPGPAIFSSLCVMQRKVDRRGLGYGGPSKSDSWTFIYEHGSLPWVFTQSKSML